MTHTAEIDFRLITTPVKLIPVRGLMHYDPADPYCIRVVFRMQDVSEATEWVFGRDLVSAGMTRETGQGDVRIWPSEPGSGVSSVYFSLSSPEGEALLECGRGDLSLFMDRTYDLVPYGAEEDHLDIDGVIKGLLGDSL